MTYVTFSIEFARKSMRFECDIIRPVLFQLAGQPWKLFIALRQVTQAPMNDAFHHLHMSAELACEFLAVFSKMEYALKATTRYAMDGQDGVTPPMIQ